MRAQAAAARVALPADDPLPEPEPEPEPELRRAVEDAASRTQRALAHVEGLLEASERAADAHRRASGRLDEAETDLVLADETHGEAERGAARAGRTLLDDVRERARVWQELAFSDETGLLDELQEWTHHLDGPYPARVHATRAHSARSAYLADEAAEAARRASELAARTDEARRELAALQAGGGREPQPPATRTPGLREQLPGAPLWRLVDFRDGLPESERAGLEAALEASGLLDAWVLPDGTALGAGWHDVLLSPSNGPVSGPSLADVLSPAVDHGDGQAAALDETTVPRLLAAIGLGRGGEAGTWVASDGSFRVGAVTGTWAKPAATYIGEGARETARRARAAVLGIELTSLREESETLAARAAVIATRRRTLDAELADVPDEAALTRAHALVSAAAETVRKARARYEERAAKVTEAAGHSESAATELAEGAADLGLPADRAGLTAVRHALGSLDIALAALWPALREQGETVRQVDDERAEAAEAEQRVIDLAQRAEDSAREAAAADERHRTLRSTVGAAVAELERRLAETAEAQRIRETDQKNARRRHAEADREAGRAEGRIEQLEKDLAEAVDARAQAVAALQRFTATGLVAVAQPELAVPASDDGPWAATPAIALARAIDSGLSATDDTDAAWERVQRRLSEELKTLQDTLSRHGHSASARMVEDGMVVDIVYQGRERAVPELADALAAEVGELTRILSAHEREILETHLITEVAGTLQELIGTAERQVRDMNTELEDRPTSTGMKLRLVWRASRKAPPGLAQARDRLRQSADAWTAEDRTEVGEFLQAQIARQKSDDGSGSRLEQLTAALDYRSWHEFGVERHQHGRWVPATGPASGGERVLAVSVPLFAAASSHYASAGSPYAPRLVTLDEAFAGVDDDSRAKCLGLLSAFDLDVVMTSEREWACYPQVPGIAIAQLSRIDEVAAVLVTRWEWDGTRRQRREDPVRHAPQDTSGVAEPEPLWN